MRFLVLPVANLVFFPDFFLFPDIIFYNLLSSKVILLLFGIHWLFLSHWDFSFWGVVPWNKIDGHWPLAY